MTLISEWIAGETESLWLSHSLDQRGGRDAVPIIFEINEILGAGNRWLDQIPEGTVGLKLERVDL